MLLSFTNRCCELVHDEHGLLENGFHGGSMSRLRGEGYSTTDSFLQL